MKIRKVKTAGHHVVKNSDWFELRPQRTLLAGGDGSGKTAILLALATINPAPAQAACNPFSDYPRYFLTKGYKRKVDPAKKTAAIAVFICNDGLREKLAAVDPVFLETDRIEVGRRLDHSRWITFVEISGSSRWSELAPSMARLMNHLATVADAEALRKGYERFAALRDTDRIKGSVASAIGGWLTAISPLVPPRLENVLVEARHIAERDQRFRKARRLVAASLPLFVYFHDHFLLSGDMKMREPADSKPENTTGCGADFGNNCLRRLFGLEEQAPATIRPDIKDGLELFHRRLAEIWPACPFKLAATGKDNLLLLGATAPDGDTIPFTAAPFIFQWAASLTAVCTALAPAPDVPLVLLIDEPGANMETGIQGELAGLIERLPARMQVLCATRASVFLEHAAPETILLLRRDEDDQGSTVRAAGSRAVVRNFLKGMAETIRT